MYIRKPVLIILIGLVAFTMVAEAILVSRFTKAITEHQNHGVLNGKVGVPYQRLIDELHSRYKAGDTKALGRALTAAKDRKGEINHVWLNDTTPNAYRDSVEAILK